MVDTRLSAARPLPHPQIAAIEINKLSHPTVVGVP